jgi:hypothetical protein
MEQIKTPIVFEEPKKSSSSRSLIVTVAVASFLAAALCVVCILGGLYVSDLKESCLKALANPGDDEPREDDPPRKNPAMPSHVKEYMQVYKFKNESMKESVWVDEAGQVLVYKKYSMDGVEQAVTVQDHKKGLMAMYIFGEDKCYLKGGIEPVDLKKQEEFLQNVQEATIGDNNEERVELEEMEESEPLRDTSILPDAIKPYCRGKAVHWVQEDTCNKAPEPPKPSDLDEHKDGDRVKRGCHYHCRRYRCNYYKRWHPCPTYTCPSHWHYYLFNCKCISALGHCH